MVSNESYSVNMIVALSNAQLIVNTRARMLHMTSVYYHKHDCSTDVIVFGGNIQRKSKFDKHVVTETRVLKFGMCYKINE